MAAEWSDRRGIDWGPNATILNEDVAREISTADSCPAGAEDGQTAVFTPRQPSQAVSALADRRRRWLMVAAGA